MSAENPAAELPGELNPPDYYEHVALQIPRKGTLVYANSPRRLLLVALAIGICVDILFYGKALGVSVPLFALLLVGALFGLGWAEKRRPVLANAWLVLPLVFFAGMVAVRANTFLAVLNIAAGLALLTLLAYFYANGQIERLGLLGYLIVPAVAGLNALFLAIPMISASAPAKSAEEGAETKRRLPMLPLLRGLILALPVLMLFSCLLASADTIFASYLSKLLNLDFLKDLPELSWRLFIILTVAWVGAGGLAYALRRYESAQDAADAQRTESGNIQPAPILGAVETATIMVTVNLLFLAFVVIQFAYLFSGQTLTTLEDSDYKHYARRGFGELITVSVLTLGMILALRWLARHDTPAQVRNFNILSSIMVALSLVILFSSWQRMFYWEEVADYIATSLRLYVRVFIVWLGLTYVWLLLTLWVRPALFALGAFVAALGFLGTLDILNPDDIVVQYNVAHAAARELYIPYLQGLSADAVPALVGALDKIPENQRPDLRASLLRRLQDIESDPSRQYWQSFNLSKAQAYDMIVKNRDKLK